MSVWAAIALFTSGAIPSAARAQGGIAARYPSDKNIGSDPAVILADDFESYTSTSQLTTKWSSAYHIANLRIASETDNYYAGLKALEMKLPISSSEMSNALTKKLIPEQDTVFIRSYQKWDPGYLVTGSNHNGLRLSGKYPGPGSAPPADGSGFFLFLLQSNILGTTLAGESAPGYAHIYAYWPKQNSDFGDHWYPTGLVKPPGSEWLSSPAQYPDFTPMPNVLPQRGRWYCYELMVKANTIGKNDGEVKCWVDGKVIADFPDLVVRSLDTLKIDEAHIALHAGHSERVNKKWYDNVVIATQYIGPMASPSPSPSPTPTPIPTPTSTPTPTPTSTPTPAEIPVAPSNLAAVAISSSRIDLSWTDNSDNETEFRVQRSTDGVNFTLFATVGANVTTYSNTGLAASTKYYYRVRSYNTAGVSPVSNVASATTSAASTPTPTPTPTPTLAPPSAMLATATSSTQMSLTWNDNSSNETGFRIQRSTDGTTFTLIATVGANITSYLDTGLTASTKYNYRARAYTSGVNSAFSNITSATTLAKRLESESLNVQSITPVPPGYLSAQWFGVFNATAASGGAGTYFNATAPGQFITYTVPVAKAGTYHVQVGIRTKPNKGIWQLAINGLYIGQPQDEYYPSITYGVRDLGAATFSVAGNYAFKFRVTGKNASSTGYTLAFDYIELVPVQ